MRILLVLIGVCFFSCLTYAKPDEGIIEIYGDPVELNTSNSAEFDKVINYYKDSFDFMNNSFNAGTIRVTANYTERGSTLEPHYVITKTGSGRGHKDNEACLYHETEYLTSCRNLNEQEVLKKCNQAKEILISFNKKVSETRLSFFPRKCELHKTADSCLVGMNMDVFESKDGVKTCSPKSKSDSGQKKSMKKTKKSTGRAVNSVNQ